MAQKKLEIPSHSFAANSAKVYPYEMDSNMKVLGSHFSAEVIDVIAKAAPLQSLIINCHGSPAYLDLGSDGLHWDNIHLWKHLLTGDGPKVKTIYMVSCNVVSFGSERDGNLFCGAVAKLSGAHVIASSKTQEPSACDKGYIDKFEEPVWIWFPMGSKGKNGKERGGQNAPWDQKPVKR